MRQLPLPVRLTDAAQFATFHAGANGAAVAWLELLAAGRAGGAWLWGGAGTGKSHLLQATCAATPGAAYLPATELEPLGATTLDGWEDRPLVCLDDAERLAGKVDWERALFALFNRLAEHHGRFVASAATSPRGAGFRLPDLASRMASLAVFRLEPLDDAGRVEALRRRARHRGLELPADTAAWLMKRLPRDMAALCDWLDRLDVAALAAQKRLTIPFVREVIGEAPAAPRR